VEWLSYTTERFRGTLFGEVRNAMPYTLGEAARATGRSKSSILRAIDAGKISATRDAASGAWVIEPVELHRVYPPVPAEQSVTRDGTGSDTAFLRTQLDELRNERERERRQLEQMIDDLRGRLSAAEEERRTTLRQLTTLLTDQRKPALKRWRWWPFGGRGR